MTDAHSIKFVSTVWPPRLGIMPTIIWAEDGERLSKDGSRLSEEDIEKTFKGGGYGLPLSADQIEIVDPK